MTRTEIAILVEAARKSCAVVEKASNLLWTHEELVEGARPSATKTPDSYCLRTDKPT
jgi:hypothetical protein